MGKSLGQVLKKDLYVSVKWVFILRVEIITPQEGIKIVSLFHTKREEKTF